jgi:hypothetical protein
MSAPPPPYAEEKGVPPTGVHVESSTANTTPTKKAYDRLDGGKIVFWMLTFFHLYPAVAIISLSPLGFLGIAATYNVVVVS